MNSTVPHKDEPDFKILSVIKCLSGEIVQDVETNLRKTLKVETANEEWKVHIRVMNEEIGQQVIITHRKKETPIGGAFYYEWIAKLTLDRDFQSFQKADFRVIDYGFPPVATEETRSFVQNTIKPFFQPPKESPPITTHPKFLIEAMLQRMKGERKGILVDFPEWPHSIPVVDLLSYLNEWFEERPELTPVAPEPPPVEEKVEGKEEVVRKLRPSKKLKKPLKIANLPSFSLPTSSSDLPTVPHSAHIEIKLSPRRERSSRQSKEFSSPRYHNSPAKHSPRHSPRLGGTMNSRLLKSDYEEKNSKNDLPLAGSEVNRETPGGYKSPRSPDTDSATTKSRNWNTKSITSPTRGVTKKNKKPSVDHDEEGKKEKEKKEDKEKKGSEDGEKREEMKSSKKK